MNEIRKSPVDSLGYHFIEAAWLPKGKDEYYLRNRQNSPAPRYRQLTAYEIEALVRNRNTSDNWNHLLVTEAFNPELVQNCKFFGLVRIGKLEPYYLEFHNLRRPVGLYNSTIISCDLGDNIVVDNVNYLSHYIIGNDAMVVNVNELATTDHAKFGNGILKEGESESVRIRMEICNENGGRSVLPFDGMLAGDAYLWSRFRGDSLLQERFSAFTEKKFDHRRGYYGRIGDRTVIKNCKIIKDALIGSDAYLKGANKLKNITINSSSEASSQIGEGCEMVNGIVGYGCRIFYGVKAVRFVMASHSQLKYGARLINSYLGDNATISCCEVLNSLIFPAHEQHHNNSFLCAALLMGQSNMAAGATVGSNHNSRSADGEIIAGRGFWPGLCVSLKHNSRFASFTLLAKGEYPAELDIPIPFSLISNQVSDDELTVMPAYWFQYNMYALARNAWKYRDRDKRTDPIQFLETDFLAPDTLNEIIASLSLLERFTGQAWLRREGGKPPVPNPQPSNTQPSNTQPSDTQPFNTQPSNTQPFNTQPSDPRPSSLKTHSPEQKPHDAPPGAFPFSEDLARETGRKLLSGPPEILDGLEIFAEGFENDTRKVRLVKVGQAYRIFRDLVAYHAVNQVIDHLQSHTYKTYEHFLQSLPARPPLTAWRNVGGQLIPETEVDKLIRQIHQGRISSWDQVHRFYGEQSASYPQDKLLHALAALREVHGIHLATQPSGAKSSSDAKPGNDSSKTFRDLLTAAIRTREWMAREIYQTRQKDYTNPFRRMAYADAEEMDKVLGPLRDNSFIKQERRAAKTFSRQIAAILQQFGLAD